MMKIDAWHHSVSPSSRQQRLELLTTALWRLADAGLGAASIITNFHHQRFVPLMERELCIFEMNDAANPVSLGCSRLVQPRGRGTRLASSRCRTTTTTSGHS
jgi:hypothetical protein